MGDLIIINGDDGFLKERAAIDEAAMSLSNELSQFKFPEDSIKYEEFLSSRPLDPCSETAIIWNASNVPNIFDEVTTIVVSAKGKNLSDNRAKRVVNVKKPKPYDDGIEYVKWILNEGDRLRIDLSRVASALFVNCGMDLRKICSEIEKLRVVSDSHGVVDPSVARRVMCFSAELTPKFVVDAICEGHPAKALAFYDKLQERRNETGWILAYMQRHVLQQLRAELMKKSGMSSNQISAALDIHPVVYEKTVIPRFGLWEISALRRSFCLLCDLDLLHKRGVEISEWGLETEIIRLSEEARQNVASRNGDQ